MQSGIFSLLFMLWIEYIYLAWVSLESIHWMTMHTHLNLCPHFFWVLVVAWVCRSKQFNKLFKKMHTTHCLSSPNYASIALDNLFCLGFTLNGPKFKCLRGSVTSQKFQVMLSIIKFLP